MCISDYTHFCVSHIVLCDWKKWQNIGRVEYAPKYYLLNNFILGIDFSQTGILDDNNNTMYLYYKMLVEIFAKHNINLKGLNICFLLYITTLVITKVNTLFSHLSYLWEEESEVGHQPKDNSDQMTWQNKFYSNNGQRREYWQF